MKIIEQILNKIGVTRVRQKVQIPIGARKAEFITFAGKEIDKEHIAIRLGETNNDKIPLVRLHSECLTGDVFFSGKCDCGEQLNEAVKLIDSEGGYLIYLRQEGRGIGLYNKLDAYLFQSQGLDTYEANQKLGLADDLRNYKVAAEMLKAMGIKKIKLLSNNPDKVKQLVEHGIEVIQQQPTGVYVKASNINYLKAKVDKTHHLIGLHHV